MAQALFEKKALQINLAVKTISAGVAAYPGCLASPETVTIIEQEKGSLEGFKSQGVTSELLESATHIFCMTEGHRSQLIDQFPDRADEYFLVTDFAVIEGRAGRDVPDPIGMGMPAYEKTCEVLNQALDGVLTYLKKL